MPFARVGTDTEYKKVPVSRGKPEGASPGPSGFAGFGKAFEGNLKNAFL